jgi:hypothetical protein
MVKSNVPQEWRNGVNLILDFGLQISEYGRCFGSHSGLPFFGFKVNRQNTSTLGIAAGSCDFS